ncbi:hypothetical protein [Streptomyces sp. HUAS ZL42]|uniref:hypothetical protein n=1 Tax=Streptomyces sp. HUAS ZL42 TaxID=3231715 RepID=UPI00345EF8CE
MVQTVGSVAYERFNDLVDRSVELVRVMMGCQFALGDLALEIAPMRTHGGNMTPAEGEELGVEDALRLFAGQIGLSLHTVRRRASSSRCTGFRCRHRTRMSR